MTVTTEQLAEWERLADEATGEHKPECRWNRNSVCSCGLLDAAYKWNRISRLAVPQLVAEVRRLRGMLLNAYDAMTPGRPLGPSNMATLEGRTAWIDKTWELRKTIRAAVGLDS